MFLRMTSRGCRRPREALTSDQQQARGCGHSRCGEMVVDLGCIEAGDRKSWKEGREESGPSVGQLAEDQTAVGNFGLDR